MSDMRTKPSTKGEIDMDMRIITRDGLGCFAGQSSMCWKPTPTGVFDSDNAVLMLNELWNSLPKLSDVKEVCEEVVYQASLVSGTESCIYCTRDENDNHFILCPVTKSQVILTQIKEAI